MMMMMRLSVLSFILLRFNNCVLFPTNALLTTEEVETTYAIPKLTDLGTSFGIVGTEDFYELVTDGEFVDKTLLISEYLSTPEKTILITRPRRFGKTVNLDMIRRFLEIELDEDGEILTQTDCINRKLFVGGTVYTEYNVTVELNALKISRCERSCSERLGKVPVLFMNFEQIDASNCNQFENKVRKFVKNLFDEHRYVRRTLNKTDKRVFDSLAAAEKTLPLDQLEKSLQFLTRRLSDYFDDKKVHILVDNYDFPIQHLLIGHVANQPRAVYGSKMSSVLNSTEFQKAIGLFRRILSNLLIDNAASEKAFLVGILPLAKTDMAKEELSSNRIEQYTLLDKPFSAFYGFSRIEVDQLLKKSVSLQQFAHAEIDRWYKGYNFSDNILYNPWSIMSYLQQDGKWTDHWIHTGYMIELCEHLLMSDNVQKSLQHMIAGKTIDVELSEIGGLSLSDLVEGPLFSYLLFTGYLSPLSSTKSAKRHGYITLRLTIPNEEVRMEFIQQALNWVIVKFNVTVDDDLSVGKQLLINGEVDEFNNWVENNFPRKE